MTLDEADPNPANGLRVFLADAGRNLRIYSYSRQDAESRSGTVLLPRAAFHLGAVANHFLRLSLPPRGAPPAAAAAAGRRRHALLYSTLDGAIGCLAQVEEAAFRRLYFLSTKMVATMQHAAGLNPRGFRAQGSGATAEGELSQVIDGALLRRFVSLGSAAQERLARQIGTSPQQLLANLSEAEVASALL
ncbi:hypothetical protein EMIHUDRAFT_435783 [Emiliania huxleyi CCMP1516]|uniref:RSE1/DDB1/CPSF1 C-terminal domain-containing protein n=2 Tax=Emiliania huxleyi TaxID=2903 RepID=A0A0D3JBV4_EMIH1|nr:hypothetical protein EMIHUDRAFT_435783 [Emiliania huxleyi CCMP1516]EOD20989.1 hypothetical protein EMIHUDRAFT_435783 [Emiliania huxleyi CCMP1516]|eukprot:XP_005773418.1 hypothetical protein EMIHUDRAFT_435783 [Emiliania huxleyi CCMP1516]